MAYPSSKISTKPSSKIFKLNPELQNQAELFMRRAYTYLRNNPNSDLKGYGRFIDNLGESWLAKTNNKRGRPLSLKLVPELKKNLMATLRASREKPWLTAIKDIETALEKRGLGSELNSVLIEMQKEHSAKVAQIKSQGMTIGHIKSLANQGLDVGPNLEPEIGKSTDAQLGNFARNFRQDPSPEELRSRGVPTNWDEYIDIKYPQKPNIGSNASALTLPIMSKHDLTMRQTAPQGGFTPLPQTTAHGGGGYSAPLTSAKQGTVSTEIIDPNTRSRYPKEIPAITTVMQSLNGLYRGTKLLFDVLTIPLGGSQVRAQKSKEDLEQMDIS